MKAIQALKNTRKGVIQVFEAVAISIVTVFVTLGLGAIMLSRFKNHVGDVDNTTPLAILDEGLTNLSDTSSLVGLVVLALVFGLVLFAIKRYNSTQTSGAI